MDNPWRDRYLTLLDRVCQRPTVYVGRPQLRLIRLFMDAYEMGLTDAGGSPDLDGWGGWVWLRFGICDPAWSTTRVIVHACSSQPAAIAAYPKLVRQFLADRDAMGGPPGIWAAVRQHLPADDPNRRPPAVTDTTVDD